MIAQVGTGSLHVLFTLISNDSDINLYFQSGVTKRRGQSVTTAGWQAGVSRRQKRRWPAGSVPS